jgi:hypothetical protein
MAEPGRSHGVDDADDLARVAALVARAGLRLPASEVAGLVTAYRSDRAGLERLREMIAADDESVHAFRAGRPEGMAS